MDTKLVDKAIIFAVNAHSGVERRGKEFPYILHPLEAAAIVSTMTSDNELIAGAILHDVVEDTKYTLEDIEREFGKRVREVVDAESEEKVENKTEEESWYDRKEKQMQKIKNLPREYKIVALGDKLSNMRAIYRDYKQEGDSLWNKFHTKDKKLHEWHYRGLVDALSSVGETDAFKEFKHLVNKVFGK